MINEIKKVLALFTSGMLIEEDIRTGDVKVFNHALDIEIKLEPTEKGWDVIHGDYSESHLDPTEAAAEVASILAEVLAYRALTK